MFIMIRLRILREKNNSCYSTLKISDKVMDTFRLKINSEIIDQFYSS